VKINLALYVLQIFWSSVLANCRLHYVQYLSAVYIFRVSRFCILGNCILNFSCL
jgi:hypothetical protein